MSQDPPAPPPVVPLVSDEQWPAEVAHLRQGFAGALNVYRVMAHHPRLLAAWEALRNHIVLGSTLSPRHLEIVILRIGHHWSSEYEWKHHVVRGRAAGLSDTEIEQARAQPVTWPAHETEAMLLAAVDELLDHGRLTAVTDAALRSRIGLQGVLDLMATVGMYTTLALVTNTFDPPIEPEIAERLALGKPAQAPA